MTIPVTCPSSPRPCQLGPPSATAICRRSLGYAAALCQDARWNHPTPGGCRMKTTRRAAGYPRPRPAVSAHNSSAVSPPPSGSSSRANAYPTRGVNSISIMIHARWAHVLLSSVTIYPVSGVPVAPLRTTCQLARSSPSTPVHISRHNGPRPNATNDRPVTPAPLAQRHRVAPATWRAACCAVPHTWPASATMRGEERRAHVRPAPDTAARLAACAGRNIVRRW